jgi:Domain of unknown function (DUF4143)
VSAWSTSLLKRLVRAQKRYLRDTGLAAAVLDVDVDDVRRNGDILGRMIETFVLAQLRAELPLYDQLPRLYHLRQEGGHARLTSLRSSASVVSSGWRSRPGPRRRRSPPDIWCSYGTGSATPSSVASSTLCWSGWGWLARPLVTVASNQ